MSLTISQLFTPEESGVGLNPNVPAPEGTWLAFLLETATTLGLPTTSWQPGAPERTIMAMAAVALSQEDLLISLMAQGGFLDFAASGVITTTTINGQAVTSPVTPDPSIPSQNSTGAPGWLDALGQSFYQVFRLLATYATGPLAIVNTTGSVINYVVGNYHVSNPTTGATYKNVVALSVPSSLIAGTGGVITGVAVGVTTTTITTQTAHGLAANQVVFINGVQGVTGINGVFAFVVTAGVTTFTISKATSGAWTSGGTVYKCTVADMIADVLGVGSNAAVGAVTNTVTANNGVSVYNLVSWSAANYENNQAYAARCRLKLGALSPNGPAQAYQYFALTAQVLLLAQVPPVSLTNGPIEIATTYADPQTGVVTTYVSSTTPASTTLGQPVTPGCVQLPITGATNATPIVISTISPHTLIDGNTVTISGVLGNTAANGTWSISYISATTFSLVSSVGTGTYTGGGIVEGGDLGEIDALIQSHVVPDGVEAIVASGLAFPVQVIATVVVPQAYVLTYQAAAPVSLANLLRTFPIGGNIPPGGTIGTVPYSTILGALIDAGVFTVGAVSIVRQVSFLTINGVTTDLLYPAPEYVAQLPTPVISVVGI